MKRLPRDEFGKVKNVGSLTTYFETLQRAEQEAHIAEIGAKFKQQQPGEGQQQQQSQQRST